MAAITKQGRQTLRNAIKGTAGNAITHVGFTVDNTAFDDDQTVIDPAGDVSADRLIKAATATDQDSGSLIQTDFTTSIDGDSELTDKTIWTLSVLNGSTRDKMISRTVRSQGIGVQAGDNYTSIGVRMQFLDESP